MNEYTTVTFLLLLFYIPVTFVLFMHHPMLQIAIIRDFVTIYLTYCPRQSMSLLWVTLITQTLVEITYLVPLPPLTFSVIFYLI